MPFESINKINHPEKSKRFNQIQLERIEIRNEKKEINYPGMPITLNLGNKIFKIIDVKENEDYNADFLLIDETFDQYFPQIGFKGIREKEFFIIGRNYPWGFELPDTVSRTHAKIGLEKGKIVIEDLNSTNGTIIEILRSIPQKPEEINLAPKVENDLNDFKIFTKKNENKINLQYLSFGNNIENIGSIFYSEFYNKPEITYYEKEISGRLDEKIITELEKLENLNIRISKENLYWLYCKVNNGTEKVDNAGKKVKIGRLLNVVPEKIPNIFKKIAKTFQEEGLNINIKI